MEILIIDADKDTCFLLQRVLAQEGYHHTTQINSADAALHRLKQTAPTGTINVPSAVLLSAYMPGLDGITLCQQIKTVDQLHDVPVIIMTTDTEEQTLSRAYAAGALDYVQKPFERSELMLRIKAALALSHETTQRKMREQQLAETAAALQTSLARVQKDLEAAARLQRNLLPVASTQFEHIRFAWHFLPCDELGGDLFNIIQLPTGEIAFYILDVAGHGVPAALFCIGLNHLLSANAGGHLVETDGSTRSPDQVAAMLNRQFEIGEESLQYFTMAYGVIDPAQHSFRYIQAGHPGMILSQPHQPCHILDQGDLPIGLMTGATYHTHQCLLPSGSRLFLYSDGITEAARPSDGEQFGMPRLLAAVEATRHEPVTLAVEHIIELVTAWVAPDAFKDDLSLLSIAFL